MRVKEILTQLEAEGEIGNVPPPQLGPILAKARKQLTEQPATPPKP